VYDDAHAAITQREYGLPVVWESAPQKYGSGPIRTTNTITRAASAIE